jgi:hypothetical protein
MHPPCENFGENLDFMHPAGTMQQKTAPPPPKAACLAGALSIQLTVLTALKVDFADRFFRMPECVQPLLR